MSELAQNILYVTRQGAYLRQEQDTVRVTAGDETLLRVPMHHLEGITFLGRGSMSSALVGKCLSSGIFVSYLTERGRFLGRLEGASSGNVLVRMEQFRKSADKTEALKIAQRIVAGKIQNSRLNLMRSGRDQKDEAAAERLRKNADLLANRIERCANVKTLDELRGQEGEAARIYFSSFDDCIVQQKDEFAYDRRSRRPPRSRFNALLSFAYALLTNDCVAACQASGLDPFIGFLHEGRPGRPSLALDLMEELRPFADRFVLTLINRRQIQADDLEEKPGHVFRMSEGGRKSFLESYQERKQDELQHPVLNQRFRIAELPLLQARLLARTIRGDIPEYPPFLWR